MPSFLHSLFRDAVTNIDAFALEFEHIVNSFTDVAELISFASFWNILDLPVVRMRFLQLRNAEYDDNFIMEQLDVMNRSGGAQFQNGGDLELVFKFVREQEKCLCM